MEYKVNFRRRRKTSDSTTGKHESTEKTGGLFQPSNLHDAVKPLILWNSIFTIGSLEYYSGRLKQIIGLIYAIGVIVAYLVVFHKIHILCDVYNILGSTNVTNVTLQGIFYINVVILIGMMFNGLFRLKKIKVALQYLQACDNTLNDMSLPPNYRQFFFYQFNLIIFFVVKLGFILIVSIGFAYPSYMDTKSKILMAIAEHYPISVMSTVDYTFFFWIRYVKIKFEQLNGLLRAMLTTTIDSPQHKRVFDMKGSLKEDRLTFDIYYTRQMDGNINKIKNAKQIHLDLVKCGRKINDAYGLHLLLSMAMAFFYITILLYNIYSLLWIKKTEIPFEMKITVMVYWSLFHLLKVYALNNICAKAKVEAATTGEIICELYEPSTSWEFRTEIRDFTMQLIENPLIFNACGFFEMDHSYTHKIIGSITTYLVILIQVGEMPEETSTDTNENATSTTLNY